MKLIKRLAGSLVKVATAITAVATLGAGIVFTPTLNIKSNSIAFEVKEQQAHAGWQEEGAKKLIEYYATKAIECSIDEGCRQMVSDTGSRVRDSIYHNYGSEEAGREIARWAHPSYDW